MAVMKEFKPGDRVEVIEDFSPWFQVGMTGTVIGTDYDFACVQQDSSCAHGDGKWGIPARRLRHIPAVPDVITIPRSDLPEVTRSASGWLTIGDDTFTDDPTPAERRRWAIEHLAIAEFLDAQAATKETAEKEAADKLAERRDEIAREVAKKGNWYDAENTGFVNMPDSTRIAIDMIIAEQDEAKQ